VHTEISQPIAFKSDFFNAPQYIQGPASSDIITLKFQREMVTVNPESQGGFIFPDGGPFDPDFIAAFEHLLQNHVSTKLEVEIKTPEPALEEAPEPDGKRKIVL
jgi:hypothetical protein